MSGCRQLCYWRGNSRIKARKRCCSFSNLKGVTKRNEHAVFPAESGERRGCTLCREAPSVRDYPPSLLDTLFALILKHIKSGWLGQKMIFCQYLYLVSWRKENTHQPGFASLCLLYRWLLRLIFFKVEVLFHSSWSLTILNKSLTCAVQCRSNIVSKEKAQMSVVVNT